MKARYTLLILIPILIYFIVEFNREKAPKPFVEKRVLEYNNNILLIDTIPSNKFLRIDRDVERINSLEGISFDDSLNLSFKNKKYLIFKITSPDIPFSDSSRVEIVTKSRNYPAFFNFEKEMIIGLAVKGDLKLDLKAIDRVKIDYIDQYSIIRKDWRNRKRTNLAFLYLNGDSLTLDSNFTKINRFISRDDEYLFGNLDHTSQNDTLIRNYLSSNSIVQNTKLKTIFFSNYNSPISNYDQVIFDSLDIYNSFREFNSLLDVHSDTENLFISNISISGNSKEIQNSFYKKVKSQIEKYMSFYIIVRKKGVDWIYDHKDLKSKFNLKEELYKRFNLKIDRFTKEIYDFQKGFNLTYQGKRKVISDEKQTFSRYKGNYSLKDLSGNDITTDRVQFLEMVNILNNAPQLFKIVFELQDDYSSSINFSTPIIDMNGKLTKKVKLKKGKNSYYISSLNNSFTINNKKKREVSFGSPPIVIGDEKKIKFNLINDVEDDDSFNKKPFHIYLLNM